MTSTPAVEGNGLTYVANIGRPDRSKLASSIGRMLVEEQSACTIPVDRELSPRWASAICLGLAINPLGVATYFEAGDDRLWLDLLIVSPSVRRQGIGRRLLLAVTEEARKAGRHQVDLGTMAGNIPMQRLAGSLGLAPMALIYGLPTRVEPDLAAYRRAETTLSHLTAEQQSQAHALRQHIKRLHKERQAEAHIHG